MKQNVFYLLILLLGLTTMSVQAQVSMNILDWTGEDKNVGIASIGMITFSEDDLVMNYSDGNVENLDMLSIRKITFSGNPTGIAEIIGTENKISVSFYSNDQLMVNNLPDGRHTLVVYSIAGALMHSSTLDSGSPTVNVSSLSKGVYIAFVNNQAIKFVRP